MTFVNKIDWVHRRWIENAWAARYVPTNLSRHSRSVMLWGMAWWAVIVFSLAMAAGIVWVVFVQT